MANDKIPALSPNRSPFELWWWKNATRMNSVKDAAKEAWDDQDARIAELFESARIEALLKEQLLEEAAKFYKRIAELEQEIQEMH